MRPYYTLHLHGAVAGDGELADTIRAMTHRRLGGKSNVRGHWTLWTFALRRERDKAARFALQWARQCRHTGSII